MEIKLGYDLVFNFPQPTPLILMLEVHPSRAGDLLSEDSIHTEPEVPISRYQDGFGNTCSRLTTTAGEFRIYSESLIADEGKADLIEPAAKQLAIEDLPEEALVYLLPSRYCDIEFLMTTAWELFESSTPGWQRVQAICDHVHRSLKYNIDTASPTKSASLALYEGSGVCRDFAHAAISYCRCMNIPARYCSGYILHQDGPEVPREPEFAAWFEAYLDGVWYNFDARFNQPRKGRVLISRGRDAADVPIMHAFGFSTIISFDVWAEEA